MVPDPTWHRGPGTGRRKLWTEVTLEDFRATGLVGKCRGTDLNKEWYRHDQSWLRVAAVFTDDRQQWVQLCSRMQRSGDDAP